MIKINANILGRLFKYLVTNFFSDLHCISFKNYYKPYLTGAKRNVTGDNNNIRTTNHPCHSLGAVPNIQSWFHLPNIINNKTVLTGMYSGRPSAMLSWAISAFSFFLWFGFFMPIAVRSCKRSKCFNNNVFSNIPTFIWHFQHIGHARNTCSISLHVMLDCSKRILRCAIPVVCLNYMVR